ncbi:complex I subunit 4 family protein [Paenibacillus kobensis]|uniref:complex I subunit 4 family protein n=1 Tax=Paenibacillus kobensis TaxID=59841 RepID=UPI001580AD5B|nr:NADH-quinone oxidoreductase subunit M [Paenibacillus kobensis]
MTIDWPILSLIVFSPLLGAAVLLAMPKQRARMLRWTAIAATLLPLALSVWLYADYDPNRPGDAYEEKAEWINIPLEKSATGIEGTFELHFDYALSLDGLSLPLVLLTTVTAAMAALASTTIRKRWKSYYIWLLILECGMLGVFLARDLLLFFIFFEMTMIPMVFLIGIWGLLDRERAATRFLLYNGLGSALMLIAFVILIMTAGFSLEDAGGVFNYSYSGSYETILSNLADPQAYANMAAPGSVNPLYLSDGMRTALFVMLLIAFGIKLPVFPFHTWMLDVHREAPAPVVMIHSGILLKMGAYGLIRFGIFAFPEEADRFRAVLAVLGVISLLYGAVIAFRHKELRLVLAYSSLSHMGIVLLGLASLNEIGMQGAVFQLVSHGLISALMFLLIGSIYERTGTTNIDELGGLAKAAPFLSGALLIGGLASLGLPGLSGFVGELLALLGLFDTNKTVVSIAVIGIILTAVYVLRAVMATTFGPLKPKLEGITDARFTEALPTAVLLAFVLLLGIYPSFITELMKHSFDSLLNHLNTRVGG